MKVLPVHLIIYYVYLVHKITVPSRVNTCFMRFYEFLSTSLAEPLPRVFALVLIVLGLAMALQEYGRLSQPWSQGEESIEVTWCMARHTEVLFGLSILNPGNPNFQLGNFNKLKTQAIS